MLQYYTTSCRILSSPILLCTALSPHSSSLHEPCLHVKLLYERNNRASVPMWSIYFSHISTYLQYEGRNRGICIQKSLDARCIDCQLSHLNLGIYLSKVTSAIIFCIFSSSSSNIYCDMNHTAT